MSELNVKCELHLNFLIQPEENNFAQRHPPASLANQVLVTLHNRLRDAPENRDTLAEVLILIRSTGHYKNSFVSPCGPFTHKRSSV